MNVERSELCALYLGLKSDTQQCKDNLSDTYTGFWDRTYTKTVFSMVEGVTFRIRQYMIAGVDCEMFSLDYPTLSFLSESTYKLDSKGRLKQKEEFMSFLPGFKFTFESFGKCLGMEEFVASAFSHNGFSEFRKSVAVRNRLTHPKDCREIMVNGKEIEQIKIAEEWFHSLCLPLIQRAFELEKA